MSDNQPLFKKSCKNVFIAATGQNVGKTTTSMGMFFQLVKRNIKAGFTKPVGQRYVQVDDIKVDEDSHLLHNIYPTECELQDMNPIAVPRGFTENYVDTGKKGEVIEKIVDSYKRIQGHSEFVVIEGTGHAGVGSIFDASNAVVASALQSKAIIVTNGGIGRSIDELVLNKNLFEQQGVEVLGVIINKVREDKYEKVKKYTEKGLKRLGVKLLGVVPYMKLLSSPSIEQIALTVKGEIIAGEEFRHTHVNNFVVGAMSVRHMLEYIKGKTFLIVPGDREDVILAAISSGMLDNDSENRICGILITAFISPNKKIMNLIKSSKIPVIYCRHNTFTSASLVSDLAVKIQVTDLEKIKVSQNIFSQYIDFDYICENA